MGEQSNSQEERESKQRAIQLRWGSPVQLPTTYANELFIMHFGDQYYLVFGEVIPPVMLDPNKEDMPNFVEIRPVAKVVVTPENMARFSKVIQQTIQKSLDDTEASESNINTSPIVQE